MKYLAVKNFAEHQHYRDRIPPWIKFYNRVLDDYDFIQLSGAARSHLMLIWLLASRHKNRVPYDPKYIAGAIHARERVDLDALVQAGWLLVMEDSASTDASTHASKSGDVEREKRRGEKREKKPSAAGAGRPVENGVHQPPVVPPVEPPPSAKPDPFPKPVNDAVYEAWLAQLGAVDYGRLRKALLPLYRSTAAEHPTAEQLVGAVAAFLDARDADDPKFRTKYTPETFAAQLHDYVRMGAMPYVDGWGEPTERGRMAKVLS